MTDEEYKKCRQLEHKIFLWSLVDFDLLDFLERTEALNQLERECELESKLKKLPQKVKKSKYFK